MFHRLTIFFVALMLLAFAVAGCGDDNDSNSSGNGDTAAETQSEDTSTAQNDPTVGSGDLEAPVDREDAVDRCKESVGKAPQLSDDAKAALQDACEKAGATDPEEIEESAREICETLVEDSIPEGSPGREAALAACDKGGQ